VADALNADEVFWAEKNNGDLYFREFIKIEPGRKVILVDDVVRKGDTLMDLVKLVNSSGGEILAIGSVINQSYDVKGFGDIVYVNLHDIPTRYEKDISRCEMCKAGLPLTKIVKE
ncbi:MAG: hypothetical protein FJ088_10155, partial [Deltaproteobacteria bacterium]|nr:hypothetical protein [Deltaproteobacteria bacterium]